MPNTHCIGWVRATAKLFVHDGEGVAWPAGEPQELRIRYTEPHVIVSDRSVNIRATRSGRDPFMRVCVRDVTVYTIHLSEPMIAIFHTAHLSRDAC